ncbi:MAG: hypothetical protein PHS37_04375 [Candidatus Omnitrophica bacterium]|nr:hypothetical protein [Candidatus Omnitrophota bacterium]
MTEPRFSGYGKILAFAGLLAIFTLIPHFLVRTSVVLFGPLLFFDGSLKIKREHMFIVCLTVYYFTFIFVDIPSLITGLAVKIIILYAIAGIGIVWASMAASAVEGGFKFRYPAYLFVLFAALFTVNFRPITYSIAYRGDEDYSISAVIDSSKYLYNLSGHLHTLIGSPSGIALCLCAVGIFAVLYAVFRKKISAGETIISIYLIAVSFMLIRIVTYNAIEQFHTLTRGVTNAAISYPYLQKWLTRCFTAGGEYYESLYRALPFIAVVFLSWFLFYTVRRMTRSGYFSALLSLALVTVPVIYYYTSLFYQDMLAMLLITLCIFDVDQLVHGDYKSLTKRPSWISFILLPFMKDTTVVFSCLIIAARIVTRFGRKNVVWADEAKVIGAAVSIYVLFMTLKLTFMPEQGVQDLGFFQYAGRPGSYLIVIKSLFNQLGVMLPFAFIGLVLIFREDRAKALFLSSMILAYILFYMVCKGPLYIGYARWYLSIVPVFIFLTVRLAEYTARRALRWLLVCSLAVSNLVFLPIHFDGIRVPNWGSLATDTSEYSYPVRDAFKLVSGYERVPSLLFFGGYYHYSGAQFYTNKYRLTKKGLRRTFSIVCSDARYDRKREWGYFRELFKSFKRGLAANTPAYIIYLSVNNIQIPEGSMVGGAYTVVRAFKNSEHTVYVFAKHSKR